MNTATCKCVEHRTMMAAGWTWTNHGTGGAWVVDASDASYRIDGTTLQRFANDGGRTIGTYSTARGAALAAVRFSQRSQQAVA